MTQLTVYVFKNEYEVRNCLKNSVKYHDGKRTADKNRYII